MKKNGKNARGGEGEWGEKHPGGGLACNGACCCVGWRREREKEKGRKGEVGFCEYFFSTSVAFAGSPWALALAGLDCWLLAGTPRSPHLCVFFFFLFSPEHLPGTLSLGIQWKVPTCCCLGVVCCLPMQVPLSKMLEGNLAPLHTLTTREYMCS